MSGAVIPVWRSRNVSNGPRRRAAVIGSGFGGLAASIRLQSMGFDTVCYEAHPQPGGRACVY